MKVKIINNSNNELPKHQTQGSAGVDLRSNIAMSIFIRPNERMLIPTGLHMQPEEDGYEIQIRPRSGLSMKGIMVAFGTVDNDYTGEIKVCVYNLSGEMFRIDPGDRIAQAVLAKHERFEFEQVSELSETERGTNGFGSTGINDLKEEVK